LALAGGATGEERLAYIGKEQDQESNLGDHGVRKYNYATGRFTSTDVLWEKYAGWSPYHYCGNNPVSRVDWNGRNVIAVTNKDQQTILDMQSKDMHKYIQFDNKGNINVELINSVQSESCNFQDLQTLAKDKNNFIFESTRKFKAKDNNGNIAEYDLGKIRIDPEFADGLYSTSTAEIGWQGVVLIPGQTYIMNSIDNSIYIYINSNLSRLGKAEIASHEFGHALFYSLGINPNHIFLPSGKEGNEPLKNQILNSSEETRENFYNGGVK